MQKLPIALAINSSNETTNVALRSREGSVFEASAACAAGGSHSEALSAIVERLLIDTDTKVSDLELLVYGKGPGSFTGLRIGLSFLQGLNFAGRKPVVGVCSLAAAAKEHARPNSIVFSATKAAKGTVYIGSFEFGEGHLPTVILPPCMLASAELPTLLRQFESRNVILVGGGCADIIDWKAPLHTGRSLLEMAIGMGSAPISIAELAGLPIDYVAPINAKTIAERVGKKY